MVFTNLTGLIGLVLGGGFIIHLIFNMISNRDKNFVQCFIKTAMSPLKIIFSKRS